MLFSLAHLGLPADIVGLKEYNDADKKICELLGDIRPAFDRVDPTDIYRRMISFPVRNTALNQFYSQYADLKVYSLLSDGTSRHGMLAFQDERMLTTHRKVTYSGISTDGGLIVVGYLDGAVELHEGGSGVMIWSFQPIAPHGQVMWAAFVCDGQILVETQDGLVILLASSDGSLILRYDPVELSQKPVHHFSSLAVSEDGTRVICACRRRITPTEDVQAQRSVSPISIILFTITKVIFHRTLLEGEHNIDLMGFSQNGHYVGIFDRPKSFYTWSTSTTAFFQVAHHHRAHDLMKDYADRELEGLLPVWPGPKVAVTFGPASSSSFGLPMSSTNDPSGESSLFNEDAVFVILPAEYPSHEKYCIRRHDTTPSGTTRRLMTLHWARDPVNSGALLFHFPNRFNWEFSGGDWGEASLKIGGSRLLLGGYLQTPITVVDLSVVLTDAKQSAQLERAQLREEYMSRPRLSFWSLPSPDLVDTSLSL